jgi:hypothetical protein
MVFAEGSIQTYTKLLLKLLLNGVKVDGPSLFKVKSFINISFKETEGQKCLVQGVSSVCY